MSSDYSEYEREFFNAVDRNTMAEQSIFDALANISDDQYYSLFEVEADHVCGRATVQVFPERAGTLYRCLNCGMAGVIGG